MANIHKNKLLNTLKLKPSDKIITVKENGLADANFILTNLMLEIFNEKDNRTCLVIMHNTLGHYHNVGKKIGYDLLKKTQDGHSVTVEPLKSLYEQIGSGDSDNNYFSKNKEDIVKKLFLDIKQKVSHLLKSASEGNVYLIIDDVSHLLDLGVDVKYVVAFLKYCAALTSNRRVYVIINCHVSNTSDELVSNSLTYSGDVNIEVLNLKTGVSKDVTGVLKVTRKEENVSQLNENIYHYKVYDREIKVFTPGESVFNLRK